MTLCYSVTLKPNKYVAARDIVNINAVCASGEEFTCDPLTYCKSKFCMKYYISIVNYKWNLRSLLTIILCGYGVSKSLRLPSI